jgi:hypothetical protein
MQAVDLLLDELVNAAGSYIACSEGVVLAERVLDFGAPIQRIREDLIGQQVRGGGTGLRGGQIRVGRVHGRRDAAVF